jgi:apolipoprotein N-acyltransferase
MAIMRGVENGFTVARSARQGLLTVSDANGRVHARAQSDRAGPVTLIARIARGPSSTPYTVLGDVFPIGAIVLAALLLALPAMRRRGA